MFETPKFLNLILSLVNMVSSSFLHDSSCTYEKCFSPYLCMSCGKGRYLKCRNEVFIYKLRDVYAVTIKEDCEGEKGMTKIVEPEATGLRLHYCKRLQGKEISFSDLQLIKYGNSKINDTVRAYGKNVNKSMEGQRAYGMMKDLKKKSIRKVG
nr:hypothetical protein [Tanacetum cinerariifolium]